MSRGAGFQRLDQQFRRQPAGLGVWLDTVVRTGNSETSSQPTRLKSRNAETALRQTEIDSLSQHVVECEKRGRASCDKFVNQLHSRSERGGPGGNFKTLNTMPIGGFENGLAPLLVCPGLSGPLI